MAHGVRDDGKNEKNKTTCLYYDLQVCVVCVRTAIFEVSHSLVKYKQFLVNTHYVRMRIYTSYARQILTLFRLNVFANGSIFRYCVDKGREKANEELRVKRT